LLSKVINARFPIAFCNCYATRHDPVSALRINELKPINNPLTNSWLLIGVPEAEKPAVDSHQRRRDVPPKSNATSVGFWEQNKNHIFVLRAQNKSGMTCSGLIKR